jgi:hypothetical protein
MDSLTNQLTIMACKSLCKMRIASETNFKQETGYLDVNPGEIVMIIEDNAPKRGIFTIVKNWDTPSSRIVGKVPSIVFDFDPSSSNFYLDSLEIISRRPELFYDFLSKSTNLAFMNYRELLRSRGLLRKALTDIFSIEIEKSADDVLFRSVTPALLLANNVYTDAQLIRYQRNLIRFLVNFGVKHAKTYGSSVKDIWSIGDASSANERFYIFCLEEGLKFLLSENIIPSELALVFQCMSNSLLKRGRKYEKYLTIALFLRVIVPALTQPLTIEYKAAEIQLDDIPDKTPRSSSNPLPSLSSGPKFRTKTENNLSLDLSSVTVFQDAKVQSKKSPKYKFLRLSSHPESVKQNYKSDVDSPKIRDHLENPKILKYLHNLAKIYQNLANETLPPVTSPLYKITVQVEYLKPVLNAYLTKIVDQRQFEPKTEISLVNEISIFYAQLLDYLKHNRSGDNQYEYHRLIKLYGKEVDIESIQHINDYLRLKAWYN